MSAGRSYRRALREAHRTVAVLPEVEEAMPFELKQAIARRRICAMTGRCPCGAIGVIHPADEDGIRRVAFEHEDDCSAPDDRAIALYRRWQAS